MNQNGAFLSNYSLLKKGIPRSSGVLRLVAASADVNDLVSLSLSLLTFSQLLSDLEIKLLFAVQ